MTTLADARAALLDLGHLLSSAAQHAAPLVLDPARCAALARHLNTALALPPLITALLDDAGCSKYNEDLGGICREREPDATARGFNDGPWCAHCQLSALLERAP